MKKLSIAFLAVMSVSSLGCKTKVPGGDTSGSAAAGSAAGGSATAGSAAAGSAQ